MVNNKSTESKTNSNKKEIDNNLNSFPNTELSSKEDFSKAMEKYLKLINILSTAVDSQNLNSK